MNREQIDGGFAQIKAQLFLSARRDDARSAAFWRGLNPQASVTDELLLHTTPAVDVPSTVVEHAIRQLTDEGYFQTPPLVPMEQVAALRLAAERVTSAGFPAGFACVYDEFFRIYDCLQGLLGPMLGDDYRVVGRGIWTFFVPPGDPGYQPWVLTSPHRDHLGPDPFVRDHRLPSLLNLWIPLTDVTPADSCIYLVPSVADPDYWSDSRTVTPDRFRLQDIRAVPAEAGSVLGWSTHLAHWGSRSTSRATGPRISISLYFQRGDIPPVDAFTHERHVPLTFETRLKWVVDSIHAESLMGGADA